MSSFLDYMKPEFPMRPEVNNVATMNPDVLARIAIKNSRFLENRKKTRMEIDSNLKSLRDHSIVRFSNAFTEVAWSIGMYIDEMIVDFEVASIEDIKANRRSYNLITETGRKIGVRTHFRSFTEDPVYGNEIKILLSRKLKICDLVNDDYAKRFLNDREAIDLNGELNNSDSDFFVYGMSEKDNDEICKIIIIDWNKFKSIYGEKFFCGKDFNRKMKSYAENNWTWGDSFASDKKYTQVLEKKWEDDEEAAFVFPNDSYSSTDDETMRIPVAKYFGNDSELKRYNRGNLVSNFPDLIVYKRGYVLNNSDKVVEK